MLKGWLVGWLVGWLGLGLAYESSAFSTSLYYELRAGFRGTHHLNSEEERNKAKQMLACLLGCNSFKLGCSCCCCCCYSLRASM